MKYLKRRKLFNAFEGETLYENGRSINTIKVQLEVGSISICALCGINGSCSTHYSCGSRNDFSCVLFDVVKYFK